MIFVEDERGDKVPERKQYGITSFIYNCRRPFSGKKVHELLYSTELRDLGVIRAKGISFLESIVFL